MRSLTVTSLSSPELVWSVSDFVAVFNQTIEYAYPYVVVNGELANFRVSKNKWVYFDLKDEQASIRFFGTIYALPGPLEDGMLLQVSGSPRLHSQFGFSITFQSIQPVGEGSIKKASQLLEVKLKAEGLFDISRKRLLPYPPSKVALIASAESAAYHDFMKILNHRWGGVAIDFIDVQVQGESAPGQIVNALQQINAESNVEVIVLTRGGGSPEDLAAFSHELVVRAVASSRIPTLVAVGHEIDISLAELAADKQASTPSNAAELLVPDKKNELEQLARISHGLSAQLMSTINNLKKSLDSDTEIMHRLSARAVISAKDNLKSMLLALQSLDPKAVLRRGYALVRNDKGKIIRSMRGLASEQSVTIEFEDGLVGARINKTN